VGPFGWLHSSRAKLLRVYDGDSIWVHFDLGHSIKVEDAAVRLYGIDTPEVRPRLGSDAEKAAEKVAGYEARDRLNALLAARDPEHGLVVQTVKKKGKKLRDKYGRVLGKLWVVIDGYEVMINDVLLKECHARPYFGKRKDPWSILRVPGLDDIDPQQAARLSGHQT